MTSKMPVSAPISLFLELRPSGNRPYRNSPDKCAAFRWSVRVGQVANSLALAAVNSSSLRTPC